MPWILLPKQPIFSGIFQCQHEEILFQDFDFIFMEWYLPYIDMDDRKYS